jgi:predicted O-methyltransferase YrrM
MRLAIVSNLADVFALRGLPVEVRRFRRRAVVLALRRRDFRSLRTTTPPRDLAILVALGHGRQHVAELGTGAGWTTAALALAQPGRRVVSYDPVVREHRDEYLNLLPEHVRDRIELVAARGADGAASAEPVDLLFIDGGHRRETAIADFRAWRPRLRLGGVVGFHDYRPLFMSNRIHTGVAEAVAELGLEGETRGSLFIWHAP